jgi:hypothetical protein
MSILDKLERVLGRFAIPNLSLYLVIGQVFVFLAVMLERLDLRALVFYPALVTEGEWWRVFTFMFVVPVTRSTLGIIFTAFGWYLFYLMGSALEGFWGTFRYNAYLFISYALTVALAFITPGYPVTNIFILGSVFLAFAYLNPDFELILFFILPVKIKWLALLAWAYDLVLFVRGPLADRLQIGAAVVAFLVFFGSDMVRTLRQGRRTAARRAQRAVEETKPRHTCFVCAKNDITHPQLDFRYCSKCAGDQCYCPEHIQNHAHVVAPDGSKAG